MENRDYGHCGLCGQKIREVKEIPKDLREGSDPLIWCDYGFCNPNQRLGPNGGRATPYVHEKCCILLCEKDHQNPCPYRRYGDRKNIERIISEYKY